MPRKCKAKYYDLRVHPLEGVRDSQMFGTCYQATKWGTEGAKYELWRNTAKVFLGCASVMVLTRMIYP